MKILRYLLGALFIFAGVLHFARPKPYLAIMPPWFPFHEEAVAVSGIAEIAGGIAMFPNRTARLGGWWLIALMIAVFPANVHMAVNPQDIKVLEKTGVPGWALWARLPLQAVAIWLVWLATKPVKGDGQA